MAHDAHLNKGPRAKERNDLKKKLALLNDAPRLLHLKAPLPRAKNADAQRWRMRVAGQAVNEFYEQSAR